MVFETEPAADPVDGDMLLTQISQELSQRAILPDGAADAISLWIMLTYCHEAFYVLPMIGITSPTKQCGKSTFQDAYKRYITRDPNVTPFQYNDFNDLDENTNVTSYSGVTDEIPDNPGKEEKIECYECKACDKNSMMCHSATMFEGKSGSAVPCQDAIKTCEYKKE